MESKTTSIADTGSQWTLPPANDLVHVPDSGQGKIEDKAPVPVKAFKEGSICQIGPIFFKIVRSRATKLYMAPLPKQPEVAEGVARPVFNPKDYPVGKLVPLDNFAFKIIEHSARKGMVLRYRGKLEDEFQKSKETP